MSTLEPRKCAVCGKELPEWNIGKYCTQKCAVEAYRQKRRPKQKEEK